jgi:hypothetical protein
MFDAQITEIDSRFLSSVVGGAGGKPATPAPAPTPPAPAPAQPNFLQRWGKNMQTGGEYAMAAGAVGTAVPALGETGIPEGVAAGGGASWLLGKGVEAVGGLFH